MFSKLHPKRIASNTVSYFKAADTVSRPMAILLSVVAILIVLALLFTLFLGGRWAVDKIWGDDEPASIETTSESSSNDSASSDSQSAASPATTTPAPATTSTPTPAPVTPTTTPPQNIPNTGPSEE